MTNTLKEILLKIAHLPKRDQNWIISQLSTKQKTLFTQLQGPSLLLRARRFRNLKREEQPLPERPPLIPLYYQSLANYCPLFIAIILEQGQDPWKDQFLSLFDSENQIKNLLNSPLLAQIKTAPKQRLFTQWKNSHPFTNYLESTHD